MTENSRSRNNERVDKPYAAAKFRFGEDDIGRLQQGEGIGEASRPDQGKLSQYFPAITSQKKPAPGRIKPPEK